MAGKTLEEQLTKERIEFQSLITSITRLEKIVERAGKIELLPNSVSAVSGVTEHINRLKEESQKSYLRIEYLSARISKEELKTSPLHKWLKH